MVSQCLLSTNDNPFDPFDDFTNWFMFDTEKGYFSSSKVARIASITDDLSDIEVMIETERAIDEIIKYDFTDTFYKVSKEIKRLED